jgi:hypothetical protein
VGSLVAFPVFLAIVLIAHFFGMGLRSQPDRPLEFLSLRVGVPIAICCSLLSGIVAVIKKSS